MEDVKPQAEHEWLQKLVGEWTIESECSMDPDQPASQSNGTETVRTLGGMWTLGEGVCAGPDGKLMTSVMTLGFDPPSGKFVGTFVASCMTHLWPYKGSLNAAKTTLTLDSEGPSFSGDGTMAKYQDIIEFRSHDLRTLTARLQGPDGEWKPFMTATYTRKK